MSNMSTTEEDAAAAEEAAAEDEIMLRHLAKNRESQQKQVAANDQWCNSSG
jgi:hypothetical protein